MRLNSKDLASGAIFIAVGLFYMIYALRTLQIGSALDMGPGYFPVLLSGTLIFIGMVVGIRSFSFAQETPFGIMPWRAIVMLTLAVIAFAALNERLGLLPAMFVTSLLSCFASPQVSLKMAPVISLGVALFCTVVFGYGIQLPIPIFGTWFGN